LYHLARVSVSSDTLKMSSVTQFQTRDELGRIKFFSTFQEAYAHAEEKKDVWKISWTGSNRWRRKRRCDNWLPQSEQRICELSDVYKNTPKDSTDVFWVKQLVVPKNLKEIERTNLTPSKKELAINLACITTVLTADEFLKYGNSV
jgi:hypothetical protein